MTKEEALIVQGSPVAYRCWNNPKNADGTFDSLRIWLAIKPEGDGNEPLYTTPQAQPKQEPVVTKNEDGMTLHFGWEELPVGTKLYTAPQAKPWVGLTAKDLSEIPPACYEGAIWADAKLKEKNA